jgi:predicted membrane GTPase involved in stress response
MHPDLPIEQLVRRRGMAFQFAFATEAKELVPSDDEFLLNASHRGLRVLGRNEEALARPLVALRDAYGATLEVEPPRVRLIEGVQVQEPIMHVRVSLPTEFREPVKRALGRRGAALGEEYVRGRWCVLRYEAPLAGLLGLSEELGRLTAGTARQWVVLSHYALVTGPGGEAA